jgi:hypothetical protein
MTRRTRFQLISTTCRRCGKPIATGSRSLFGLEDLKTQYDRVCQDCLSSDEQNDLLHTMGEQIAARVAR